jgi:hypothetical protein
LKIQEWNDFGGFQLSEVRGRGGKKRKNYQIYLVGFECVVKDIEA